LQLPLAVQPRDGRRMNNKENLRPVLIRLASITQKILVNQKALAVIFLKDVECVNDVSRKAAQKVIDDDNALILLLAEWEGLLKQFMES
jgi:hypothetical protein